MLLFLSLFTNNFKVEIINRIFFQFRYLCLFWLPFKFDLFLEHIRRYYLIQILKSPLLNSDFSALIRSLKTSIFVGYLATASDTLTQDTQLIFSTFVDVPWSVFLRPMQVKLVRILVEFLVLAFIRLQMENLSRLKHPVISCDLNSSLQIHYRENLRRIIEIFGKRVFFDFCF